jgi:hypothetical protein
MQIYFDLIGEFDIPEPDLLDGFVQSVFFYGMQTKQDLQVRGTVSRQTLINLSQLQEFWVTLCPERYRRIQILPDKISDAPRPNSPARAILAFSGGSDASFTLLRHRRGPLGNASLPIDTAVLIQHDPMIAPGDYAKLVARTAPLLKELQVCLKIVRTNLHQASKQHFNDSHAAQISACLHNFSHDFDYAVLGSSEPYRAMLIPWGSTPATDYLLSTPLMRFVHDGAAFSRTEKIIEIAKNPTAAESIQVCWMSAHDNCGSCGKCLRTRLNFLAAGIYEPPCFEGRTLLDTIDTIPIPDAVCRNELSTLLAYAHEHNDDSEWVARLRRRLASN